MGPSFSSLENKETPTLKIIPAENIGVDLSRFRIFSQSKHIIPIISTGEWIVYLNDHWSVVCSNDIGIGSETGSRDFGSERELMESHYGEYIINYLKKLALCKVVYPLWIEQNFGAHKIIDSPNTIYKN
jgi:hypothetical protein